MRPMDDGAAYAPGPGTAVCRLLRSAEGFWKRSAVPKENSGPLSMRQGLTLVHVRAQLEQLQDTFVS